MRARPTRRTVGQWVAAGLLAACGGGSGSITDFQVTWMDVVQGVQTPFDSLPLVAYKPTFVRVYVRSHEAGHGPWRVTSRLVVRNPTTFTEHELLPMVFALDRSITASPTGSHREIWGDSFTFELDHGDTKPGACDLRARVFAGYDAPVPPSAHVMTRSITFHAPVDVSIYGVVWSVTSEADGAGAPLGPAASWSDFEAHRKFVANTFPATSFSIKPIPGIGLVPPKPQPFTDLTESRTWATKMVATLPAGSRINLLDNWSTPGLHGYAWGAACEEQNARDGPRIGKVMAQEVSHVFGLWCHTFDPCDGFPRASGQIDELDIGFNRSGDLGRTDVHLVSLWGERDILDGMTATGRIFDFMSYGPTPIWISSFTYCQLVRALWPDGPTTFCGPGTLPDAPGTGPRLASPPRAATSSRALNAAPPAYLFLVGRIGPDAGTSAITAADLLRSLTDIATPQSTARACVAQLLDANGGVLRDYPFDVHVSDHDQGSSAPFGVVLPFEDVMAQAVTVALLDANGILVQRPLATTDPSVDSVVGPVSAGGSVSGLQTIAWTASDPSQRPLTFTVLYSADGGNTWWPLNTGLTGTSADVDFDSVPGSDAALLKIRASNGGRSSERAADAPFVVSRKLPRVAIDSPADGETFDSLTNPFASGSAFSWEEGVLTDPDAFSWTVDGAAVGTGSWAVLRGLVPGPHTLTLTVHDSAGRVASTSVTVTIEAHP